MLDVKQGVAEGKSLDMYQVSPMAMYDTMVKGVTNDYTTTAGSDVVVITSGLPRKPGMSRDDLVFTNGNIVKEVTEQIVKYSPNTFIIVVSNPLDAMSYVALKTSKFAPNKVVGMAGILDTARYKAFISEDLDCSPKDVQALILGGHGDDMVALKNYTTICGIPVTQFMTESRLDAIIRRTRMGGGEIVNLLGMSAWYAPGFAAAEMVEAILLDQKRVVPCSAYLEGKYGLNDIYFGVPCKLGKNGVEFVVDVKLNPEEKVMVEKSAANVRSTIDLLKQKGIV